MPEEKFIEEINKLNKSRGFYMPKNNKAVYKEHNVLGRQVLIVQKHEHASKRAIQCFLISGSPKKISMR